VLCLVLIQIFCRSERPHLPDADGSFSVSGPPADVGAHEGDGSGPGRRSRLLDGARGDLWHRRHVDSRQPVLSDVT